MLATLTLTWGYFRLPETKDRTFGEMDILVRNIVAAISQQTLLTLSSVVPQSCFGPQDRGGHRSGGRCQLDYARCRRQPADEREAVLVPVCVSSNAIISEWVMWLYWPSLNSRFASDPRTTYQDTTSAVPATSPCGFEKV